MGVQPAIGPAALRDRLSALGGLVTAAALQPRPRREPPPEPPGTAERAAELGFEPMAMASGGAWVRRISIDLAPFLERAGGVAPASPAGLVRLTHRDPEPGPWRDSDIRILDIETLGLRGSGVVAFLVGIGRPRGDHLDVDQLLLTDLGDEAALLDAVATLAGGRLLVTYNGRTFDVPVLVSRCIVNRRPADIVAPAVHCDLLAPVRRLFRDRLGACTLRQAELGLLGLDRGEDVPGFEAPARFRAWLRGAPASVLEGVVRHNEIDVCATAVLAARLVAHAAGALVAPVHPADRYNLGVHLENRGDAGAAIQHLRDSFGVAHPVWSHRAGHRLARRLRRDGDAAAALLVWAELRRRHPDDLLAARQVAIARERAGDLAGALAICDEALALLRLREQRRLQLLRHPGLDPELEAWRRREQRLRARQVRATAARARGRGRSSVPGAPAARRA
jgi:uncharacterized protein YprB with RNaseH-like and TPR domain